jgi:hypothetical protein
MSCNPTFIRTWAEAGELLADGKADLGEVRGVLCSHIWVQLAGHVAWHSVTECDSDEAFLHGFE